MRCSHLRADLELGATPRKNTHGLQFPIWAVGMNNSPSLLQFRVSAKGAYKRE